MSLSRTNVECEDSLASRDRALNPGSGLHPLCVDSLISRDYSAGMMGSREKAVDLLNVVTSSVFYLRDIHSIGKELNFSFNTCHHSNFIFFDKIRDVTWQVMRNEFFRMSGKMLEVFDILF